MTDNSQAQLNLKSRQIELFLAIDEVRDKVTDGDAPNIMYMRLLKLLMDRFHTHASAMVVLSESDNAIENSVAIGLETDKSIEICTPLLDNTETAAVQRIEVEGWAHAVGVRVKLSPHEPLGAIVLMQQDNAYPFTDEDLEVLRLAEQQIDSSIIQARRIWQLAQRKRELDAIYKLDKMRDERADEGELVTAFIQIIMEQFQSELCIMFLSHPDSGELTTRGMVDKAGLRPDHYAQIAESVERIVELQIIESPKPDLNLLACPFIVNDMRLGAVVVGRRLPFSQGDKRLLVAMSSQMDSAVVYSRVIQQLSQRNKELNIIYNIDRIRDSDQDFGDMLQAVLGELCKAIDSELGYILLYSESEEDQLEIKATTNSGVITSTAYYEAIHTMSKRALDAGTMVYDNNHPGEVRSIIAVPLILHDKIIGVFGGVNSIKPRGYNAEDRRMLNAIVSQTDTAVFERMEQRRVRQVLGRSVDPKVLEHLLKNSDTNNILSGERMVVSVLFGDLRGSTEWAERTEPDKLAYMLNEYLGRMTDVIFEFGGTLDKFVGDEVIGLFGAPLPMEDHAERCAKAALKMQEVMADLIREMEAKGNEIPPMGIGVSSGEAICGEFGTSQRTDYTAMGRMMNLGARLCSAAAGGEVMISEGTYAAIQDSAKVERRDDVSMKGIGTSTAYKLLNLEGES